MKRVSYYLKQFAVLFLSILKWAVLSAVVGCLAGGATALFVKLLSLATNAVQQWEWFFVFLPLVLFVSGLVVKYLAPDAAGHGTEKVIEAIHRRDGKIDLKVVPVKLAASVITIAGGGSAGKEGPSTQIGAGLASFVAGVLRLRPRDRRLLVTAGLAAGFASVFSAPFAGAVFAVEVLACGKILLEGLFPCLVAAVSGVAMYRVFDGFLHIGPNFSFAMPQQFQLSVAGWCLLAGLFFGLVAFTFIKSIGLFERLSEKIKIWKPLKGLIGGAALVGLTFAFGREYLSVGSGVTDGLISGTVQLAGTGYAAFLIKIVFTSITLAFCGSGGVISPTVFVGASAGYLFGLMTGHPQLFAALGFVGVLAGCANTPIAAAILAAELFGASVLPYAAIVCALAYLFVGYHSMYPSQILDAKKSYSLVPDNLGGEFGNLSGVSFSTSMNKMFSALSGVFTRKKRGNAEDNTARDENADDREQ